MGKHRIVVKAPAYELQVAKLSRDEAEIVRKTGVDSLRDSIEDDLDMRLEDGQIFSGHLLYPNMRPLSLFVDGSEHHISEEQIKTDHFCKVHPVLSVLNPSDSDFFLVRRAVLDSSRYSSQTKKKFKLSELCFEVYRYQLLGSTFLNLTYSVRGDNFEFDSDSVGDETFSLVTIGAQGKHSEVRVSS
jgi:hypothetical protein